MRGGSELASTAETSKNGLALDYATAWSYGRTESLNLLVPDFMGRESGTAFAPDGEVAAVLNDYGLRGAAQQLPAYWGTQPYTGGPTYLGAAAIFLAALGVALVRGRNKWWIVAVSALTLLLAWGRNLMWFTELAFDWLPGYNKFRTVSMALVVVQWTVPLLGALAHNVLAGVGDGGHAGIGHERARLTGEQAGDDFLAAGVFVVLVVAHAWFFDLKMVEELRRHACVLGGDEVGTAQRFERAHGQVAEVADRRADQIQCSAHGCVLL